MPRSTYFVQDCSTCGRKLQVRVEYLGKKVACQHCGARFVAADQAEVDVHSDSEVSLIDRADELIRQSGINLARAASASRLSQTSHAG